MPFEVSKGKRCSHVRDCMFQLRISVLSTVQWLTCQHRNHFGIDLAVDQLSASHG